MAWEIANAGVPRRLEHASIALEEHLEDWIDADIGIVADDVLLIGRQLRTEDGTYLDLLGIDRSGDLVVIELKRDKTLRDTVAQAIDYAEWCYRLSDDRIMDIAAARYGGEEQFRDTFTLQLGVPFPESLNGRQRLLVVAPTIPDHTSRVIEYLAKVYTVPISAVDFDVFGLDGKRILVRHTVVEEATTGELPAPRPSQPRRSLEDFIALAHENGVGPLFEHLLTMKDVLPLSERFQTSFAMKAKTFDKRVLAGFTVYPTADTNPGFLHLVMSPANLSVLYGCTDEMAEAFIRQVQGIGSPGREWTGWIGTHFETLEQVQEFDRAFRALAAEAPVQVIST
ncbi:MAG: DUF91 domain-containing protein [Dehalococcoidia bacterium]|nr:DUF91 domain-containing protein [Dehalococcoidia bacterium]